MQLSFFLSLKKITLILPCSDSSPNDTCYPLFFLFICVCLYLTSEGKESACNSGNPDLIPGLGRSPGEGNGDPLQYSCLEFHGQRSLVGSGPWDRKGSDTYFSYFSYHFSLLFKQMPFLLSPSQVIQPASAHTFNYLMNKHCTLKNCEMFWREVQTCNIMLSISSCFY